MGIFITNILCCLSRLNRDRIRANGQENKKTNDNARALNLKSHVARIYLFCKEDERGLRSVEDTLKLAILGLERYVLKSEEGLLMKKSEWRS